MASFTGNTRFGGICIPSTRYGIRPLVVSTIQYSRNGMDLLPISVLATEEQCPGIQMGCSRL